MIETIPERKIIYVCTCGFQDEDMKIVADHMENCLHNPNIKSCLSCARYYKGMVDHGYDRIDCCTKHGEMAQTIKQCTDWRNL